MKTEGWVQHKTGVEQNTASEVKWDTWDWQKWKDISKTGRTFLWCGEEAMMINPWSTVVWRDFCLLNPPPCWIISLFLPQVCSICPRLWSFSSSKQERAARGTPTARQTCAAWNSVYWPQQWAASRNSVSLVYQSLGEDLSMTQSKWCFESIFVGVLSEMAETIFIFFWLKGCSAPVISGSNSLSFNLNTCHAKRARSVLSLLYPADSFS